MTDVPPTPFPDSIPPVPDGPIVVRGGWDGHQPIEATDLFIPFLEEHGFRRRVRLARPVRRPELMAATDLIVQCMTMSTIEQEQFAGLGAAVEAGTGLAGWHGGIVDSYRDTSDYLQLVGGQFACHPGKHPDERIGEQSDNYVPYRIAMLPAAADHPITAGIGDFDLVTEQYWVLTDDYSTCWPPPPRPYGSGIPGTVRSPHRRSGPGTGGRAGSSSAPPATGWRCSRCRRSTPWSRGDCCGRADERRPLTVGAGRLRQHHGAVPGHPAAAAEPAPGQCHRPGRGGGRAGGGGARGAGSCPGRRARRRRRSTCS